MSKVKIYQTKFVKLDDAGNFIQRGNCLAANIATLLGLTIWDVPPFEEQIQDGYKSVFNWLESKGYQLEIIYHKPEPKDLIDMDGYYIACGKSPRNSKIYHGVIHLNGEFYHDPHPDDKGIASEEYYLIIHKIFPSLTEDELK